MCASGRLLCAVLGENAQIAGSRAAIGASRQQVPPATWRHGTSLGPRCRGSLQHRREVVGRKRRPLDAALGGHGAGRRSGCAAGDRVADHRDGRCDVSAASPTRTKRRLATVRLPSSVAPQGATPGLSGHRRSRLIRPWLVRGRTRPCGRRRAGERSARRGARRRSRGRPAVPRAAGARRRWPSRSRGRS